MQGTLARLSLTTYTWLLSTQDFALSETMMKSIEEKKAMKHSRTSVIVFSKDYASSRWCLDELVMILERKRISADHVVLLVFYDVDPSDVRKQTGSLAKAFARHQKTQPSNKVKEWREALAKVADLAGMVLQNQADGHESKFINKIVQVIGEKLRRRPLIVPHIMIGMHSRINKLNLWLQDGSNDVGILVTYGMSRIGKTTIAKSVYNSNFGRFEGSSFLENIKEVSQQPNGLVQIQTQLLSDILYGRKVKIRSVNEGMSEIEDAISSKRVFLVLDDVDHISQLDVVLGMKDQFYPGSKIIITTRRARLLKANQVTEVHAVQTLTQEESLELFSWHAFGQDHPVEDYIEYSEKLVNHCGGLPLYLSNICIWKSALEKLEAIPNGEIINKLRVSYDSLQDDHGRNLFLHIACFFIGMDKDYIAKILDRCDFYTIVGIENLIDRCLVTIVDGWDKVQMHDLIRGMGREIVRLESKEPWKCSKVWHHEDSFKILTEKNGTDTIEGLVLDMHMCPTNNPINSNEKVLETNAFSTMHELKPLHLSHVKLDGCYAEFYTGLRWLCWLEFPLDSIPTDFPVGSLIVLEMQYSGLRQIYEGTKECYYLLSISFHFIRLCLLSLKILDLSHSHSLTETIDFSYCPNLEKLVLVDCTSLIYVHGSIGNLERLIYLNMKDCKNLRMLPKNICMLKSLETFIISCCSNLNELSIEMLRNMDSLKSFVLIADTKSGNNPIGSLPNCIKGLTRLHELNFHNCTSLKSLLGLPKVRELYFGHCITLEKITYQSSSSRECIAGFGCNYNLVEWEYSYKLQPIGSVDVEMINLLGLCNLLESMEPIRMHSQYECLLKDDPIPIQSNGLRGAYCPSHYSIPGEGEDMIWLSHWNLDDQLQGGDEVVVSVIMKSGLLVKELGIQLVQVQQEENHNMMSISTDSSYDHQYGIISTLGTLMKKIRKTKKKSNRMISQLQPPQAAITQAASVAGRCSSLQLASFSPLLHHSVFSLTQKEATVHKPWMNCMYISTADYLFSLLRRQLFQTDYSNDGWRYLSLITQSSSSWSTQPKS
ncbi:Disease resistance protein TIR-NBS-LRR class family [Prunus dulcis]|uniref:Disease resistance protein TIR-NBS-LRR class family n=1 Tax=Prunus dulcis TaxID=3755 RepID=A0A4Y1RNP2_PRUDU|nr:Disease resistance protein TIR-NBS-LRR class family [Prunus dulcis]